ncbi:hypothetical protein [Leptolyngbya sp. FACHB-16]|uniref:hypothetical protein n=1 Tax=unclassified Leptolyngbya TaxID=2650499 RepID=UPI0016846ED5|nr:hypothetical protein [Leptolyngbya sp. FACHB-16]MBD2156250.1 hypothetical protein [Leptolyngbya sp. FACHB-16]
MDSHSHLPRFINRFFRWLRASVGAKPEALPPGTKIATNNGIVLWRLESDEPGVVAAWWIVNQYANRDLAIALINLARLREDLATGTGNLNRGTADPLQLTSRKSFRAELNHYLAEDEDLNLRAISHIFVVAFQGRTPNANRHYKVEPLCAIPCDLQGIGGAWAIGDRRAMAITEAMARQLLRLSVPAGEPWENYISRIDWLGWLQDYTRHQFGNAHVLQPRKVPAP